MSVIQRGMRSSTRSKAVIGRVRGLAADDTPAAAQRRAGSRVSPPLKPAASVASAVAPSLSDGQRAAAEQLAEIFAEAEFEVWARGGPSGDISPADPLAPSPSALIARSAYRDAMRAVPVLLSPILVHVCCLGLPLGLWAAEKRVPLGQAETGLRQALSHLVRHFRGLA